MPRLTVEAGRGTARVHGRGVWLCPDVRCVRQVVERGGLGRALRAPVEGPADAAALGAAMGDALLAQAAATLRRAWRAGPGWMVAVGVPATVRAIARGEAGLVVVARDAAAAARRRVGRAAGRAAPAAAVVEAGDRVWLGAVGGGEPASALCVRAGRPEVDEVTELCRLAQAVRVAEASSPAVRGEGAVNGGARRGSPRGRRQRAMSSGDRR
ncbi:MAG TPA: YlxR family protein [Myxococcota bacterium]|nr:YlxR family protein [Myxococcota bacterium]